MKQVFLIHSYDAAWVTSQRETLIDELIPREMRDEGLHEFISSQGDTVRLQNIIGELVNELATVPFLPDSRRVLVVHNPADLLAGGSRSRRKSTKKKTADTTAATPSEFLIGFIEKDLPATTNALILSLIIDPAQGQYLDQNGALYKFLARSPQAVIIKPPQREEDPLFRMSDALLARDAPACLRHFRSIHRPDVRLRIFSEFLKDVRLLIQANILDKARAKGKSDSALDMLYLPSDKRQNLNQQPEFVQKKIKKAAQRFALKDLMTALERLLTINRTLYPGQNDTYVPDVQILFETFIIELCAGSQARR